MILSPNQIGWQTAEFDPRIYKRAIIQWKGAKEVNVPEDVQKIFVWPLSDGRWPEEKDSLNEVAIVGVIDRIFDTVSFWKNLYRVCSHGAYIHLWVPYWTHADIFCDPTRIRGVSERYLRYLSSTGRLFLKDDPYDDGVVCNLFKGIDLDTISLKYHSEPEWEGRAESDKQRALNHLFNTCRRLEATLFCYKPARGGSDI